MSAYIVPKPHIFELALFAVGHENPSGMPGGAYPRVHRSYFNETELLSDAERAQLFAEWLWSENHESYAHRYPDELAHELEEHLLVPIRIPRSYRAEVSDPVAILKMCAGFEYQACEHPGWHDSNAYRLLNLIRMAAIRELPGYEDAPWCYDGQPARAVRA